MMIFLPQMFMGLAMREITKHHENGLYEGLSMIGVTALAGHFINGSIVKTFTPVVIGYAFAWVGHFFFEKNKPATFKYPVWSMLSDLKMYYAIHRTWNLSGIIPKQHVIACIGDQWTQGENVISWPMQLQYKLSVMRYRVWNFGCDNATAQKKGNNTYHNSFEHKDALGCEPDVVVIMLGINDSKIQNWDEQKFFNDYVELARSFQNLRCKPKIYIMQPPPVYKENEFDH